MNTYEIRVYILIEKISLCDLRSAIASANAYRIICVCATLIYRPGPRLSLSLVSRISLSFAKRNDLPI